jgi:hypothetical protein
VQNSGEVRVFFEEIDQLLHYNAAVDIVDRSMDYRSFPMAMYWLACPSFY